MLKTIKCRQRPYWYCIKYLRYAFCSRSKAKQHALHINIDSFFSNATLDQGILDSWIDFQCWHITPRSSSEGLGYCKFRSRPSITCMSYHTSYHVSYHTYIHFEFGMALSRIAASASMIEISISSQPTRQPTACSAISLLLKSKLTFNEPHVHTRMQWAHHLQLLCTIMTPATYKSLHH